MPENTWIINDSVPITLSQTFEAPAAEWTSHDWLVGLGMVQAADAGAPSLNLSIATTDENDILSCSVSVVSSAALSTSDTDDTVSCALQASVTVTLALADENDIVSVSTDADITLSAATNDENDIVSCSLSVIPSDINLSLSSSDEDDAVSCSVSGTFAEISLSLATADEDDAVFAALAIAHAAFISGGPAWTPHPWEWPVIQLDLRLRFTDEDDVVSCLAAHDVYADDELVLAAWEIMAAAWDEEEVLL